MHLPKTLFAPLTLSLALASAGPALAAAPDVTAPVVSVPADVYYVASAGSIVTMDYTAGAVDDTDLNPSVSCLPRSGSQFAFGTTTVTCTATDAVGHSTAKSFNITVASKANQVADPKDDDDAGTSVAEALRTPRVNIRAYRRTSHGTRLLGVRMTRLHAGAAVKIVCQHRCPGALRSTMTVTSRGESLSLASLFQNTSLRMGTKVKITTSGHGLRTITTTVTIRRSGVLIK